MKDMETLRVSMVETNLRELELENKTYIEAFEILKKSGLDILYESRTSILTLFQRELYEKVVKKAKKELAILLDPIVVAFAVHDACDLSSHDYAWLDLEGNDEVGNSAWTRDGEEEIVKLTLRLLRFHLEKYFLDAYDRQTREDMARVWEAQLKLLACPVCGDLTLERRPILTGKQTIRAWTCSGCSHHVVVQADVLRYLQMKDLQDE